MTNDSRRFGFTYGYDDAVTAAMQERTYQWMDIVFGLRLSILEGFYVGHTTHINIFKSFVKGKENNLIPYFIPGYGPEENSFNFKFDFYFGINIPLYDDPKFVTKR